MPPNKPSSQRFASGTYLRWYGTARGPERGDDDATSASGGDGGASGVWAPALPASSAAPRPAATVEERYFIVDVSLAQGLSEHRVDEADRGDRVELLDTGEGVVVVPERERRREGERLREGRRDAGHPVQAEVVRVLEGLDVLEARVEGDGVVQVVVVAEVGARGVARFGIADRGSVREGRGDGSVRAQVVLEVVAALEPQVLLRFDDEVVGDAGIEVEPQIQTLEAVVTAGLGDEQGPPLRQEAIVADAGLVVLDGLLEGHQGGRGGAREVARHVRGVLVVPAADPGLPGARHRHRAGVAGGEEAARGQLDDGGVGGGLVVDGDGLEALGGDLRAPGRGLFVGDERCLRAGVRCDHEGREGCAVGCALGEGSSTLHPETHFCERGGCAIPRMPGALPSVNAKHATRSKAWNLQRPSSPPWARRREESRSGRDGACRGPTRTGYRQIAGGP